MSAGSTAEAVEAGEIPIFEGPEEDGPIKHVTPEYLICETQEELEEIVLSFGESPSLHGLSTPLCRCSHPLMHEAVGELGVHHIHQFGRDLHRGPMLQWVQVKQRALKNFGKSILRILRSGGTTESTRGGPRSPDFKHKVTRKALWIDGWSTPPWVKTMLELNVEEKLRSHSGYHTRGSQDGAQPNRVPKGNYEKGITVPTGARESRQVVRDGGGVMHVRSARTTIEAIAILKNYLEQGIAIDSYMYVDVLKRCLKEKHLAATKQVHECIIKSGMEQNTYVANNLLRVYIRCGRLQEARQMFDELVKKTIYSWNIMIGGYAEHNHAKDAIDILDQMCQGGTEPNEVTYSSILKACGSPSRLKWGREIHGFIRHAGLESDVRVGTALVQMYAKCGGMEEARQAFEKVSNHNVISWTVMIGAYAESGCGVEAYELFLEMQREGCVPNAITFMSILNPCASAGALPWVREVHSHAVKAGLDSDLRVGNALVHMYARSGSLDDAREVFDRMKERDVITWTVMIGAYADSGCGVEAHALFVEMVREGFRPDAVTYMSILKACAGALEWVKEVHRCAQGAGLESDLRVGNVLIHSYARSGSVDDARRVFERMQERDVITWNVMIGAYADSGCGVEAHALFLRMVEEGFTPDAITYMGILDACARAGALEWVKEVHRCVQKAGHELDLRVGNALVHSYAKSGSIEDARQVFDRMKERDVITWNVMIGGYADSGCVVEAHSLFLRMVQEGFKPDAVTYVRILNACASTSGLKWVKDFHCSAPNAGLELDSHLGNALIHSYAKSGSIDDAVRVFEGMKRRDVITWTVMIGAYGDCGSGLEARRLFFQMQREGFKPDAITYSRILNAFAEGRALEWVREVHCCALESGLLSDFLVGNALIAAYARTGSLHDARLVFDRMENRDLITWNGMIGAYAEGGCGVEAHQLLLQMRYDGLKPDASTFLRILNSSANISAVEWVKEVHNQVLEAGLGSDLRVGTTLIHIYARLGRIDDARLVFDRMEERDVITWTAMIGAYAERGFGVEAYELFLQMQGEGCSPNAITFMSILNPSASTGALDWVKEVHSHALKAGLNSDLRVGSALVHMYAKSGSIDDARLVFDRMDERNVITWTVMIGGLAQHGCGREALDVFRTMNEVGLKPDGQSFVAVLLACSHAGFVDEGRQLFLAMSQDYGIEPTVVHCTCMVDLLGRAGHLEEAKGFIANMAVEPNGATWGALLGACRSYGNIELGELAAKECLKLEPKDASACVLLSNIYAAAGKWEAVIWVRSMMQERGIRKEPGRSWIEVDNKVHDFVVGDTSHPDTKEIYAELSRLSEKVKAEGYIPDTRLVLRNMDEEEKAVALCSHSEKLAIAYGLLRTPHGEPIRVYKNLRVCSDCHTATKFISKVTQREIVARDANRFHHFKDGVCSCGDYW